MYAAKESLFLCKDLCELLDRENGMALIHGWKFQSQMCNVERLYKLCLFQKLVYSE